MANLKSVKKDIRRTRKRRIQNATPRTRLRTFDKKIRVLVEAGQTTEAEAVFRTYTTLLDRAGRTNLIHHKQADRRKSRMAALILKKKAK